MLGVRSKSNQGQSLRTSISNDLMSHVSGVVMNNQDGFALIFHTKREGTDRCSSLKILKYCFTLSGATSCGDRPRIAAFCAISSVSCRSMKRTSHSRSTVIDIWARLSVTSEIIAGILSPCPTRQNCTRSCSKPDSTHWAFLVSRVSDV